VTEERVQFTTGGVDAVVNDYKRVRDEAGKPVKAGFARGYEKALERQSELQARVAESADRLKTAQKEVLGGPRKTDPATGESRLIKGATYKKNVALVKQLSVEHNELLNVMRLVDKEAKDLQLGMISRSGRVSDAMVKQKETIRATSRAFATYAPALKNLEIAEHHTDLLNERLREEKRALAEVNKQLEKQRTYGKETKKDEKRLQGLTTRQKKLNDQIRNTSKQLKLATMDVKRFNEEATRPGILKHFARGSEEISRLNKRLGIAAKKIITYRIAFGAWRQTVEVLRDTYQETIKIDSAMQDLKKVMQATQPVFDRLQRNAFRFGAAFGRSVFEVVEGFKVFAQQGLSSNEILNRMQATMLAVAGSTLTANQAVEALTAVYKNFPELQARLTDAVDKWTKVAATAPVTAQDLANAVKSVGTAASAAFVSLDELNGIVAAVAEVTRKSGSAIGMSFKTIFARFPRTKTIKALQDLGVLALKDANTMRNFSDVMGDLNKKWGSLTDLQKKNFAQTIAGIRRYNDFLALMRNYDTFLRETSESQRAFGFAQQAAEADTDKLQRRLQAVQTRFEQLRVAIGEGGIVGTIVKYAEGLEDATLSATGHGAAISNLIMRVIKLALVMGGLFTVITLVKSGLWGAVMAIKRTGDAAVIGATKVGSFATALAGLARVLSIASIAGIALYAGWEIYKAVTDDAATSTIKINELIEEQRQKLIQYRREVAAATGNLKKFEQTQKVIELDINIQDLSKELIELNNLETKLLLKKEDSLVLKVLLVYLEV
jgi:TP901 family phage tail tape measure protein